MDDCIFCKIVKGEIPVNKVYEGEFVIGISDANPQASHHYLLIPKKHIPDITSIEDEDQPMLAEMFNAVRTIAGEKGIKDSGFRIVLNQGKDGGQAVFHLHMHILGGRPLGWPPG